MRGQPNWSRGDAHDDDEARRRRSDAMRLHGSYRYMKYGPTLPPAFSYR
jgi:hypothetical protein